MRKADFIWITIIAVLILISWKSCNNANSFQSAYEASQDTLHQSRNKLGQEETKTAMFYGKYSDLKNIHANDSSTIGKLKQLIDRNTISATVFSATTGNNISSSTDTVISRDTVWKNNIAYVFPEYRDTINTKWEYMTIAANKDSMNIQYKVFNEFHITQSWDRSGFLKRKIPMAAVTNLNPHTHTTELQSFTLKENRGNRIRDGLVGFGIGALLATGIQVFNVKIPISFKK